jgi:uncharacterized protein YjbK
MKTPVQHHQEREWKYRLETRDEYLRLLEALGPQVPVSRQHNSYWLPASPELAVLRLRQEGGRCFLTLKGPSTREGARFSRRESELELDQTQARALLDQDEGGARGALEALGAGLPLVFAGNLVNDRRTWQREGFEVALDESFFPRGPQLEIEFEQLAEEVDPLFPEALLRSCGVEVRPARGGKFGRLREELAQG